MLAISSLCESRLEGRSADFSRGRRESPDPLAAIDAWLCSPPTAAELWQYALEYRRLGFNVFPVRGKIPVCRWKDYQARRLPQDHLRRLIFERGATGLAAIAGWISGHRASADMPARKLCVRDYDSRDAFLEWAESHPDLATTLPLARTARGYHVYCWSRQEAFAKFGDGELRATSDAYVLVPPSATS